MDILGIIYIPFVNKIVQRRLASGVFYLRFGTS